MLVIIFMKQFKFFDVENVTFNFIYTPFMKLNSFWTKIVLSAVIMSLCHQEWTIQSHVNLLHRRTNCDIWSKLVCFKGVLLSSTVTLVTDDTDHCFTVLWCSRQRVCCKNVSSSISSSSTNDVVRLCKNWIRSDLSSGCRAVPGTNQLHRVSAWKRSCWWNLPHCATSWGVEGLHCCIAVVDSTCHLNL